MPAKLSSTERAKYERDLGRCAVLATLYYGEQWRAPLARDIDFSESTLRKTFSAGCVSRPLVSKALAHVERLHAGRLVRASKHAVQSKRFTYEKLLDDPAYHGVSRLLGRDPAPPPPPKETDSQRAIFAMREHSAPSKAYYQP